MAQPTSWALLSPRLTTSTITAWARIMKASSTTAIIIRCWNDYVSPAAPTTCVPFVVTNKGYGLLWDNPSKTTIEPGFNERTRWWTEVGDRVSYFVDRRRRQPTRSTPVTSYSLAPPTCCPRRPTDTSSASSVTPPRRSCWPWPRAIATATSPPTCWWWTGSTTPRWARWTWTPGSGPTPRP